MLATQMRPEPCSMLSADNPPPKSRETRNSVLTTTATVMMRDGGKRDRAPDVVTLQPARHPQQEQQDGHDGEWQPWRARARAGRRSGGTSRRSAATRGRPASAGRRMAAGSSRVRCVEVLTAATSLTRRVRAGSAGPTSYHRSHGLRTLPSELPRRRLARGHRGRRRGRRTARLVDRLDDRPRPGPARRGGRLRPHLRGAPDARLGRGPAPADPPRHERHRRPAAQRGPPRQGARDARLAERRPGDRGRRDRLEPGRVREPRRRRPVHVRGAYLDETIRLWRHLWSGSSEPFRGRFHTIEDFVFGPLPEQAGPPDRRRRARRGGPAARRGARRRLPLERDEPGEYAERHPGHPSRGGGGRAPDANACRRGSGSSSAAAGDASYAMRGSPDEIAAEVRAFAALGVTHLALYFDATDPAEIVARAERFDREVAPLVLTAIWSRSTNRDVAAWAIVERASVQTHPVDERRWSWVTRHRSGHRSRRSRRSRPSDRERSSSWGYPARKRGDDADRRRARTSPRRAAWESSRGSWSARSPDIWPASSSRVTRASASSVTSSSGIVGAVIGGFLAGLLTGGQDYLTGINISTIVVAVIGAVIAVLGYNLIRGRTSSGSGSDLSIVSVPLARRALALPGGGELAQPLGQAQVLAVVDRDFHERRPVVLERTHQGGIEVGGR